MITNIVQGFSMPDHAPPGFNDVQSLLFPATARARPIVDDKAGHRTRLRERFMRDDGRSMHDYELLELFLTQVIKRRDVKPIAKPDIRPSALPEHELDDVFAMKIFFDI